MIHLGIEMHQNYDSFKSWVRNIKSSLKPAGDCGVAGVVGGKHGVCGKLEKTTRPDTL